MERAYLIDTNVIIDFLADGTYSKIKKIKLPDAIIAATALHYDLTLLSRNEKDFNWVDGLTLENPWEASNS